MAGAAIDLNLASEKKDPLPHAGMAEAGADVMFRLIEAHAIVLDDELKSAVQGPQPNLGSRCSGMAGNVVQSFLGDAKKTKRHVMGHIIGNVLDIRLESDRADSRKTLTLGLFSSVRIIASSSLAGFCCLAIVLAPWRRSPNSITPPWNA